MNKDEQLLETNRPLCSLMDNGLSGGDRHSTKKQTTTNSRALVVQEREVKDKKSAKDGTNFQYAQAFSIIWNGILTRLNSISNDPLVNKASLQKNI